MSNNGLTLTLRPHREDADASTDDAELLKSSRALRELISDNVAPAKLAEGEIASQGEKGMAIIGTILVEAVAAEAAKKLVNCFKAWLGARKTEFTIRIEKNGDVIDVSASNLGDGEIGDLAEQLEALLAR